MELLVSVRSVIEAETALAGGAGLIDVKEPSRGSLGRADDEILQAIHQAVAGRCPVSAALGELSDNSALPCLDITYVKWGLSRCGSQSDWRETLRVRAKGVTRPVAVAYADWRRADAPTSDEVCRFACEHRWGAFLIDTWRKDGSNLLDWVSMAELQDLRDRCQEAAVPLALAGSLGPPQIRSLLTLRPTWFAVRGAVCRGGQRESVVDGRAVAQLVELLRG